MRLPHGLRALRHRDYRLFFGGQLVSQVGTWMQSLAQSWLVLELTGSPFKLGLIGALQFGPMLLFSFHAGAIADRVHKKRMILFTQTALMLQAFAMALLCWSGRVQYWHVAVLAFCYGLASTLDLPVRQSFVVEMTGKEDLASAVALNSAGFNGARMIGPAVAGVLVAHVGVAPAFALNGLSFLGVLLALNALRAEGLPRPHGEASISEDIAAGLRYALHAPLIRLLLCLLLFIGVFVVNHSVMVPLLARHALGVGARGFGLLMASLGIGAVAGALSVSFVGRRPRLRWIVGSACLSAVVTVLLAAARDFRTAALLLSLLGFFQVAFMALCNTTLQAESPDALRGRILSLYAFVFAGITPIGSLLMGSLAQWFGTSTAYAVGGGCGLAGVLGLSVWEWSRRPARGS
ncbi:MAG: MFS transporter [Elusimicrobiota bacterium]|jgi:MFS family permease